ncbi:hypothetical protein B0A49_04986 [Cryomyces minteri]|uniref:Rad21/Rec8-like protein N-terminal domain-containing protein n=1 Tax=Cryomyces minteri TaxID=331657 RepID=A0A4V6WKV6_9PEZI|nr:hypothetical protein B0A49_04986 [Cryomyces minteri]
MFYSYEVLTSRKYGVATVWLVATLGSKSTLKKVNRRAILDVDIPKACETVIQPEAPMALRLQSNLLYGVSRVYSQQCGYVLVDAQTAQNSMRALLRVIKTAELDPEVGRASGGPVGDIGGFVVGDDGLGTSRQDTGSIFAQGEDDGFLPEADFGFDAEGNLLEYDAGARAPRAPVAPMLPTGPGSDTVASARARQEHEEGQRAKAGLGQAADDDFVMSPNDDYGNLPVGEAFPTAMGQVQRPGIARSSSAPPADGDASDTAGAPLRRKRKAPKVIQMDQTMELRNGDLARWNTEYLQNMAEASKLKLYHKAPAIAKRNADFWVLGRGIGNIGSGLGHSGLKTPLDLFCGPRLLELLTGVSQSAAGQKHGREDEEDHRTDDSGRRVRPREEDGDQVGRGDVGMLDDDMPMLDDGIELGRDAPSALDDMSSAMPWNISASRRGSSVPRTGASGLAASAGGLSSIGGPPGSLSRRGSRLVSASPLLGRSRPSGLEELRSTDLPELEDEGLLGGPSQPDDVAQDQARLGDFELHGPGAQIDTQTAAQSQWTRQALDNESLNFLGFIETGIEEVSKLVERDAFGEQGEPSNAVSFEELLPRASNSRIVAAQALLHTLALATKNLIRVEQQEAFGRITIQMVQTLTRDGDMAAEYDTHPWQEKMARTLTHGIQERFDWFGVKWKGEGMVSRAHDHLQTLPSQDLYFLSLQSKAATGEFYNGALMPVVTTIRGIDISPNMVDAYNARARASNFSQLQMSAAVGDLFATPPSPALSGPEYADFDIAAVGLGFHHFEDSALAVKRLAERLKVGTGVLVILDFLPHNQDNNNNGGPDGGVPEAMRHTIKHDGFDKEGMRKLFEAAGFEDFGYEILMEPVTLKSHGEERVRRVFIAKGRRKPTVWARLTQWVGSTQDGVAEQVQRSLGRPGA